MEKVPLRLYKNVYIKPEESIELPKEEVLRIEIDTDNANRNQLGNMGMHLVDRTIGVKVSLKSAPNFSRNIRFPVREQMQSSDAGGDLQKIKLIAYDALLNDYRFNLTDNNEISKKIIEKYLEECNRFFVAERNEETLGFIGLREESCNTPFIHMAAVKKEYQATGVSVSLYSYVMLKCKEEGWKAVYGRISSSNMPVLNLYASLGGRFAEPRDIFIRANTK